ncbi:MAG TPA: hypothetical protein VN903_02650, partial [Polyangia bacterium]|nr:hypothetical protein [Polyangia bacterium]
MVVAAVLGSTSVAFAAAPTAATTAATNVLSTSALLNGSGNPNGEMTTGWYRVNTTNPGTCNDTFGTRVPATGGTSLGTTGSMSYAISATGLMPGTTYYFCAITGNPSGNGFGSVLSFTTPGPPAVVTTGATSIAATTALLNGTANPTAAATTGWFRLYTTDPGTCSDSTGTRVPAGTSTQNLGMGTTPAAYSFNTNTAISLTPGTTYWYCALANNSLGTSVGAVVSFLTLPVVPTVSTTAATALTATTATL